MRLPPHAVSIALALLCATAVIGDTPERRSLTATRAEAPITLDGRLDEACWQGAEKASDFIQLRSTELARQQSTGAVVYDDEYVYFGVACDEPRMDLVRAHAAERPARLDADRGQTIELFIDANHGRKTFLQVMLNTDGSMTTYTTDPMQVGSVAIESAVAFGEGAFSIECRIPFAFVHPQPNPEKLWGLNICRTRAIEGRPGVDLPLGLVYSAWQNPGPEFRRPENFGDLSIGADLTGYQYDVAVRPGEDGLKLDITNLTGADRAVAVEAFAAGEMATPQPLRLARAQTATLTVAIPAGGAETHVVIRDADTGTVRFIGGTRLSEQSYSIAAATDAAPGAGNGDYVVFAKHYLERGNHRTLPRPEQVNAPLEVFAGRGEYEPASLAVRANKPLQGVNVALGGDLKGPDGATIPASAVDIRIAELMTRWLDAGTFERVECFLIRNRARDIAANTTQRYWLTVHVPLDTAPGRYETTVRVAPANAEPTEVPLRVEVLPLTLGRPRDMNYFMYFHLDYFPPELRTPEYVRRCLIDMREHGMTTATLYAWPAGQGWVDINRDLHATNVPMAVQMDLMRDTGIVAPWGAVPWIGAESYGPDLWKVVAEAARERNWPELLWYLVDEPTQERMPRVEKAMQNVAAFRERNPDLPIRTTTAGASDPLVSDFYDVWIAGCYIDLETIGRGKRDGKAIWTYDCGLAPVDAITDRHYFGVWTWAAGLKGASHWAYYDASIHSRWNLKSDWRDSEEDLVDHTHWFNFVYPKSDELIPTIGWEAVREGVDDARYLVALETAVRKAVEVGVDAEAIGRAQAALDAVRAAVHVDNLGIERTRCKQVTEETGRPRVRDFERRPPEPDLSPANYDRMRYDVAMQLVSMVDALRAKGVEIDFSDPAPGQEPPPPPPLAIQQVITHPTGDDGSLLEACEDLTKTNTTFAQKHWDPKGTQPSRIGDISVSKDEKVQGEGSVHWVVTREHLDNKLKDLPGMSVIALDYLYGRQWGPIAEVRFHIKCENPNHPPLYVMLNATGASPVKKILDRGETTDGWREVVWDVKDADIGVSEQWGKIVWLFRWYAQTNAFEAGDTIDLYLDNIRLIAAQAEDVSPAGGR